MRYFRITIIILFLVSIAVAVYTWQIISDKDVTAPVISADQDTIYLKVKDKQEVLLDGLQAKDDRDGDLTDKIVVERISNFISPGECVVDYVVFDSANNVGRYQRKICYEDYTHPRLVFDKPMLYYASENVAALDGVRLIDSIDGDISHKLKLEASNVIASEAGIYEICILGSSNFGDDFRVRLPLNIIKYSSDSPVITLKEYLVYTKKGKKLNPLKFVKEVKDSSGQVIKKSKIKIKREVDLSKEGAGQICLEVTDTNGVKGITYLTVIVEG